MSRKTINSAVAFCVLMGTTFAMLLYFAEFNPRQSGASTIPADSAMEPGPLSLRADLVQDKIYNQGNGKFALSLLLSAPRRHTTNASPDVDLVVVLDRSGSMRGNKLSDAKLALCALLDTMTPGDRIALVSYSTTVTVESPLTYCTTLNLNKLVRRLSGISAGGGTNLGGGLRRGIDLALEGQLDSYNEAGLRASKVILVSDGLANHGVTDPFLLGSMATRAVNRGCRVSTVGLGLDFNEQLMTTIADQGTGSYYYLEDAQAFAQTFTKEFLDEKNVAAAQVEVRIPLPEGVQLVQAGGYPIETTGDVAVFRPGNVRAGQSRRLYLTFQAVPEKGKNYVLKGITVQYAASGRILSVHFRENLTVCCVADAQAAQASIRTDQWEQKVVSEDYNKLREEVARAVAAGDKTAAEKKIEAYRKEKSALNAQLRSPVVAKNLRQDLGSLNKQLDEAFSGNVKEARLKQKSYAKTVQHESYIQRRAKN